MAETLPLPPEPSAGSPRPADTLRAPRPQQDRHLPVYCPSVWLTHLQTRPPSDGKSQQSSAEVQADSELSILSSAELQSVGNVEVNGLPRDPFACKDLQSWGSDGNGWVHIPQEGTTRQCLQLEETEDTHF